MTSHVGKVCGAWQGIKGGAAPAILELANGPAMKQRQDMIEKFAKVFNEIGLPVPSTGDPKEIGQAMVDKFQGKAIKDDPKLQTALNNIANAINSYYGGVINKSMSVEVKVAQVLDFIHALSTGLHTELLQVRGDLQNIVSNISDVQTSLKISTDELNAQIEAESDDTKLTYLRQIRQVQYLLEAELSRQLALLSTITGTYFTPAEEAAVDTVTHGKKIGEIITRIKATTPGQGPYAESMLAIFRGLGYAAVLAARVNDALKASGLSVQQFESVKDSPQKLVELLTEEFKKLPMNPDSTTNRQKLTQFMSKTSALMDALDPKYYKEVIEILKTQGATTGSAEDEAAGGYIEVEKKEMKTKIQKQVEDLKQSKKFILDSFNREFSVLIKSIYNSIDELGKKSADGLMPISDALEGFIKNIVTLKNLQKTNLYYTLSGLDQSPIAKANRENYVEELKILNGFIDQMVNSADI